MSITEVLMGLGSWQLELSEQTPDEVRTKLGPFGHVAVVDGPVDVAASGDGILPAARYVGVLREGGHTLAPGGSGMAFWLGDEDDKGPVLVNPKRYDSATLAAVVADLLAETDAVVPGVVHDQDDPDDRYSGEHQYVTVRRALTSAASVFGAEFRVNGDATVDVGTPGQLYGAAPAAIIARRGAGSDLDLTGVGADFTTATDAYDFTTEVVLLGQTQDNRTIATGSASAPGVAERNLRGGTVRIVRMISESGEGIGTVAQRARLHLNRFYRTNRQVALDLAEYETDQPARVGHYVWVYDPDAGLVDPANEVEFRGEVLHPILERVSAATWSIRPGMTVAFRTDAGEWLDLTPYVVPATAADEVTVGDLSGRLTDSDSTISDRLDGLNGGGGVVNAVPPNPPTGLTLATVTDLDSAGVDVSVVVASWTAPTENTDGSPLLDLAHYSVQWRLLGQEAWEGTSSTEPQLALPVAPGLQYGVRVRAVDSDGQASTWSQVVTIVTAADAEAPPVPSAPIVGNYLGQLRIEWDGRFAGSLPRPADFARLDVHVGPDSGFTPDDTNLVASMGGVGGVVYATAPYGIDRWVRFVAWDRQGNDSGPSQAVSGATSKLLGDDVFDGAIGSAALADLAVITAKIDDLAVNDAKISDLSVGKLTAGTLDAEVILGNRIASSATGARVEFDNHGLRMYDGAGNLRGDWRTSLGQLRIYNTTDATHTSTGHGIQFGDDNGENLIIDTNEIMVRDAGTYGRLLINREGGRILIGGKLGGFPTVEDYGTIPADGNHAVIVRSSLQIYNSSDGEYLDEFPPFVVGLPFAGHLWMDNNEIGATAETGDAVGTLYLQGRRNSGVGAGEHHTESVVLSSDSLGIRRWGTYSSGTRAALLYNMDGADAVGVRLVGNGTGRVSITDSTGAVLKPLEASNVALPSSRRVKRNIGPISAALDKVRAAPAQRWQYDPAVEDSGTWHLGPMAEDLPGEVMCRPDDPQGETAADRSPAVSLPSMVGLLWEAVRALADRVDALPPGLDVPPTPGAAPGTRP